MFKTHNAKRITQSAKGFTLIEIIIVLIIVGVLAALGLTQYGRMIERSRGGEAKEAIGTIRKLAAAFYMQNGALDGSTGGPTLANTNVNIGTGADQNPSACAGTHFFSYGISSIAVSSFTITATRCEAGGKTPNATPPAGVDWTLTLIPDFATGTDTWSGTGSYQ